MLGRLWICLILISAGAGLLHGSLSRLFPALMQGAQEAVQLCISLVGPLCLWSGLSRLLEETGAVNRACILFQPILGRLFPSCRRDRELCFSLCGNFCANLLGLGNAATPMGIRAVRAMQDPQDPARATDEICRLVVLNTASVQLIPTTVAAIRSAAGSTEPFEILPCVWITSLCSVSAGLAAAWLFSRAKNHG